MSAYAIAVAGLLSELRTRSGAEVVRTETETRIVVEAVTVCTVPTTDDALDDIEAAIDRWSREVVLSHAQVVDGLAGEA